MMHSGPNSQRLIVETALVEIAVVQTMLVETTLVLVRNTCFLGVTICTVGRIPQDWYRIKLFVDIAVLETTLVETTLVLVGDPLYYMYEGVDDAQWAEFPEIGI